jgi:hypothetical protein
MAADATKVVCETPTPGKKPTRIARWKYEVVRSAILNAVPAGDQGVESRELPDLVRARIPAEELDRLGSVSWYTTTVKLDLEVKGELERVPGSTPQRLRRGAGSGQRGAGCKGQWGKAVLQPNLWGKGAG